MDKQQRICKICNKRFANGKAMGGHMRSHLAKLPIPPKPKPAITNINGHDLKLPSSSSSQSFPSTSCSRSVHPLMASYESYLAAAKPDLHDRQSDTESPRNPTRRRSRRLRKSVSKLVQTSLPGRESVSSVSETFSDIEEVAMCLLMLSNDKWVKEENDDGYDSFEDEDDADESSCINGDVKYRCETCKKRFTSYQALGGHRASHKNKNKNKNKNKKMMIKDDGKMNVGDDANKRLFSCEFCSKVFQSGQALGGHKKIHFSYYLNTANNTRPNYDDHHNLLDLNLPAPQVDGDDDDDEVSQLDFSSICDTDMCDPTNSS